MTTTEILIKAAIIENQAVHTLQQMDAPGVTGYGQTALAHMADAFVWSLSVLTAEPVPSIRARIQLAARDRKPCNDITRPRLRVV